MCAADTLCKKTVVTWNEFADSRVNAGVNDARACCVESCQAACELNTSCTGVDWDSVNSVDERCWLHGPWSGRRDIGGVSGVTHYDINRTGVCLSMFVQRSSIPWKQLNRSIGLNFSHLTPTVAI